jgi:hypothetical protein
MSGIKAKVSNAVETVKDKLSHNKDDTATGTGTHTTTSTTGLAGTGTTGTTGTTSTTSDYGTTGTTTGTSYGTGPAAGATTGTAAGATTGTTTTGGAIPESDIIDSKTFTKTRDEEVLIEKKQYELEHRPVQEEYVVETRKVGEDRVPGKTEFVGTEEHEVDHRTKAAPRGDRTVVVEGVDVPGSTTREI